MFNREKFVAVDAEIRPGHYIEAPSSGPKRRRRRMKTDARPMAPVLRRVLIFTWFSLFFMAIYMASIGAALFSPGYGFWDRFFSVFLLIGLVFISFHGIGYANSLIKASWGYRETKTRLFSVSGGPKVTCIIASFNEPPDVLEETISLVSMMDYGNKEVVLLDDSTKEEARTAAREIGARYGVKVIQRTSRRGYKAGAINDFLKEADTEYLAIFDADALPAHNFLADVMPMIAENPRLAFLQTPQHYANTEVSNVAMGASRQQNVFYEYICEGKSYSRAMFCCGTNVIFRKAALLDVGGFDESNVTEDFATSFLMHQKGWDSLFLNRVYVYSLAPETLDAYFTQQSRWAFGTTTSAKVFLKAFFKNPTAMRAGQWWEYFLSSTYYWIGLINLMFMLLPLVYVFFGIRPLRQDNASYAAVFIPYFLFSMNMFYVGMNARGYSPGEMILGQQIAFITFPTHIASAISGVLGRKRPFALTPKGVGGRLPWQGLWPQFLLMGLSALAVVWGFWKYFTGADRSTTAILVNAVWALYHVWMLGSIFKFNRAFEPVRGKAFFEDPDTPAEGLRGPMPRPEKFRLGWRPLAVLSTLTILATGWVGFSAIAWVFDPIIPVNVYVLDRTAGRDLQQHRALFWTLNFLKVRKQEDFGPNPTQKTRFYNYKTDYYGFVPAQNLKLKPDATGQGDLVAFGRDRALPSRLQTPAALYLADAYGEYTEYDAKLGRYVRMRSRPRGLSPKEIASIENFARQGGLLIGERNVIGWPTKPGTFPPLSQIEAAIRKQQAFRVKIIREIVPDAQTQLQKAEISGDFRQMAIRRGQVEDAKGQIADVDGKISGLKIQLQQTRINQVQNAAHARLEKLLHASYKGWYGRYIEKFEDQKEYDLPLWKSVRDYLTRQNKGVATEPKGPGFVFYPDGPSQIFDSETNSMKPSPFGQPVAVLGKDLGQAATGHLAMIYANGKKGVADDPLLQNVAEKTPFQTWFEVVEPTPGSRVLAYYKLGVSPAAAARLIGAGFPRNAVSKDRTQLVFPALVAWRDGGNSKGALRSLYFAGDAGNIPVVSRLAERVPALGGVAAGLSRQAGDFNNQYFWGYYEPVLRNIFQNTGRVRYQK